jgi:TetR/AcrR family transcriptional regulator, cholesterol catabolism regulator
VKGQAPPEPTRRERGREDILAAAALAVAERGYHGMSMRDLARATGQSLANLYNYFASKDDLLFALQSRAFESLLRTADEAVGAACSPEERLYAFVLNHVRFVASHPEVMRVLVHEAGALPPRRRKAMRELKERYFESGLALVRSLAQERAAGTPDSLALERATYCVFGMLNWLYGWYEPARHGGAAAVARSIHALAMGGLVGEAASGRAQLAVERRAEAVELLSPVRLHEKALPA